MKLASELETLPSALLASPSKSMTRTCMPLRDPSSFSVSAVPAAWSRIAEAKHKWQLHYHDPTHHAFFSRCHQSHTSVRATRLEAEPVVEPHHDAGCPQVVRKR